MFAIIALALIITFQVCMYEANAVVVLTNLAPYLYTYHVWTTVAIQTLIWITTFGLFIASWLDKNDRETTMAHFIYSFRIGFNSALEGAACILSSALLVRATANHPQSFAELPLNLVVPILCMYATIIWVTITVRQIVAPNKDKK